MSESSLHQEPERDQFKTESPIRAFTDWNVMGIWALGKGFRPSLAHVVPYINAMEEKEGWRLVQILEGGSQTPSFLFRQSRRLDDDELLARLAPELRQAFEEQLKDHPAYTITVGSDPDVFRELSEANQLAEKIACGLRLLGIDMQRAWTLEGEMAKTPAAFMDRVRGYADELYPISDRVAGFQEAGEKMDTYREMANALFPEERVIGKHPALGAPYGVFKESMNREERTMAHDGDFTPARNMAGQVQEWGFVHHTEEKTGGKVNYYLAKVPHPRRTDQPPYQAECEDIIAALGMTFDEGCEFKAIWRTAAARLGSKKAGQDAVYDAEKRIHYAKNSLETEKQKACAADPNCTDYGRQLEP